MDITALLARTANTNSAPTDARSTDNGPAFTRTLAAAIAGSAPGKAAAEPLTLDTAAAEQLLQAGNTPQSKAGNTPLESSLWTTAPVVDQLQEEIAEKIAGESDTDPAAETGDAVAPPPLLATGTDGPRPIARVIPEAPPPARPTNAAMQPVQPKTTPATTPVREQDTAIAASATALAEPTRPATGSFRGAVAPTDDGGTLVETAGNAGRSLPGGAAEVSAPASATAAAPSGPATATAAPTAAPAQASLPSPLASAPWRQELGQQLQGMVQRGDGSVELHLNPRELGPLSVSLQLDDQGARAQFLSAHAAVRTAVELAVPQLREALAEQGISLGETSVGEQRQESGRDDSAAGRAGTGGGSLAATETETTTAIVQPNTAIGSGRVDLYA